MAPFLFYKFLENIIFNDFNTFSKLWKIKKRAKISSLFYFP